MKNRISIFALLIALSGSAWAQSYDLVMQQIRQNNISIEASQKLLEAEKYNHKTGLFPDDPTVEYGYFPGNNSSIGIKRTFDVTQGFQFPTTYFNKKKISESMTENSSYLTQKQIQDILYNSILSFLVMA